MQSFHDPRDVSPPALVCGSTHGVSPLREAHPRRGVWGFRCVGMTELLPTWLTLISISTSPTHTLCPGVRPTSRGTAFRARPAPSLRHLIGKSYQVWLRGLATRSEDTPVTRETPRSPARGHSPFRVKLILRFTGRLRIFQTFESRSFLFERVSWSSSLLSPSR